MTAKTCPHCHGTGKILNRENAEENFRAMQYYYELGDGIVWNVYERRVVFKSEQSAHKFGARYIDWRVEWTAMA